MQLCKEERSAEIDTSIFGRLNRQPYYTIKPESALNGNGVIDDCIPKSERFQDISKIRDMY